MSTAAAISVQGTVRSWLREWADGRDIVRTEEAMVSAEERFIDDEEFIAALVRDSLRLIIPAEVSYLARRGRRYVTADGFIDRDALEERAQGRFARWRESVDDRTYKPLLDLTKPELEHAASMRQAQAQGHLRHASFLLAVAKGLDDGQVVRERFTEDELAGIWKRHERMTLKLR